MLILKIIVVLLIGLFLLEMFTPTKTISMNVIRKILKYMDLNEAVRKAHENKRESHKK